MGKISPPEPLNDIHELSDFESGEISLDEWLKKRAKSNHKKGASRTFVIHEKNKVIGFYCLAAGSVEHDNVPKKLRRNMPEQIPILVLGRLAVDKKRQKEGLGRALLKDAILRTVNVSNNIGVKAILVHALSEKAKKFYLKQGFKISPIQERTLMLPISEIKKLYGKRK